MNFSNICKAIYIDAHCVMTEKGFCVKDDQLGIPSRILQALGNKNRILFTIAVVRIRSHHKSVKAKTNTNMNTGRLGIS